MSGRRLLHFAWESYLAKVIPVGAPALQITESRKAFFAGAYSLEQFLIHGVSEGADVTAADERLMLDIEAELAQWHREVLSS